MKLKEVKVILTVEQKKLITDNHNLIYEVINKRKLPIDDYYDIGAIAICEATLKYNKDISKFNTFAYHCIDRAISNNYRDENFRQKRKSNINKIITYYDENTEEHIPILETIPAEENIEKDFLDRVTFENQKCILGQRELFIVEMLMLGYSQIEIATKLGISKPGIVKSKERIRRKLIKEGYV